MGKAGKARKRQRLERELGAASHIIQAPPLRDEDEDEEGEMDSQGPAAAAKEEEVIPVLEVLGLRPDLYYSTKALKPLRTALFPLIDSQHKRRAFFEPSDSPPPTDQQASLLTPHNILALTTVATTLSQLDPSDFSSPSHKAFRRALHPLVVDHTRKVGGQPPSTEEEEKRSLSALVSAAFRRREWEEARGLLREMRRSKKKEDKPRLGALQRWVRDCDLATTTTTVEKGEGKIKDDDNDMNMTFLLLDAVLRVASGQEGEEEEGDHHDHHSTPPTKAIVTYHPPFRPCQEVDAPSPPPVVAPVIVPGLRVVSHVPGPQRRPPSPHDLNIYTTAPHLIFPPSSTATPPTPKRYDVPFVPGAFLMSPVLSPEECQRLITTAEAIGYTPDVVEGIDCLQWLADPSLLLPLYDRVRPLLPQHLNGCALKGINARWRLFRYYPGAVYRPHIDGSWPGSGYDDKGNYSDDIYKGVCNSRLTFLVYLNGGFSGGGTTFFLPGNEGEGCIDARAVEPRQGAILCFPHGDAEGSLVHEGSRVGEGGVKYIIRSDVLYSLKPSS